MDSASAPDRAQIACLVLAAGAGTRFGGEKQLAELAGRPLLEHAVGAASRAAVGRVVVVLGAHADEIRRRADLGAAEVVVCEGWRAGISAALSAGIEAVAGADAAVVVLGDQPLVSAAATARVLAARRPDRPAVRATYGGRPGHPVVIERSLFGAARELRGDAGARDLLARAGVIEVACDEIADPLDVDSPEDLALAAARIAS